MRKLFLVCVIAYVSLHFLLSILLGIGPAVILKKIGLRRMGDRYIRFHSRILARGIIRALGGRVTVHGLEHLPDAGQPLCIVSNHRSILDIPVTVGYLPLKFGFIAKKELRKIPILRTWMEVLGCVYIDRKNPRSQIKAILDGVEAIKNGKPQLIFPEGTRSRHEQFGTFKPGSIKLATRSQAIILPITIRNTSLLLEGWHSGAGREVSITIHPPIPTGKLNEAEQKALPEKVFSVIRADGVPR